MLSGLEFVEEDTKSLGQGLLSNTVSGYANGQNFCKGN